MSALPVFFSDDVFTAGNEIVPDEQTARHIVQVLRMQPGEPIQFADGKGNIANAIITKTEKKKCTAKIERVTFHVRPLAALHLAIAPTKNASRNEWLLEKATELGVSSIILLNTTRTEREKTPTDRWHNILISAMLQSQQYYLPQLRTATLPEIIKQYGPVPEKLMAHCIDDIPRAPLSEMLKPRREAIILIGPEGDFTADEVNLCTQAGFNGISLGTQRLRTETAAMAACAYFNMINNG